MHILLLGSGGREHALAWKLSQSPHCTQLWIAPGNPGTAQCGQNVSLSPLDFEAVGHFCIREGIDIVIVGPEEPLVKGITDYLRSVPELKGMTICGPGSDGAQLEGSKAFAKAFMQRHSIPTAAYGEFGETQLGEALAYLRTMTPPYVIKADGLAAGKGVVISSDLAEAEATVRNMFGGAFGEAGKTIVLEEFLDGIEFSVFVLTDGEAWHLLPVAKDYKRIGEGDTGPNTGGMGAVSPVPFVDTGLLSKVQHRIIEPTIKGLRAEGITYQGFIFFGLINCGGEPKVIEYNCRMGDPETEVVMPRLDVDLPTLLRAMSTPAFGALKVGQHPATALTVMMVSEGYPGDYPKGRILRGVDASSEAMLFHAGTALSDGKLVTNGGRVLACTVMGEDLSVCRVHAYDQLAKIDFEGAYYRRDIGLDLL
jgi:phosphoribosylamine--glycine ligase